jgi:hypothetical protein
MVRSAAWLHPLSPQTDSMLRSTIRHLGTCSLALRRVSMLASARSGLSCHGRQNGPSRSSAAAAASSALAMGRWQRYASVGGASALRTSNEYT